MEKEKTNVVINDSKGYGYTYASLGDIAKQGYTIPKMKIGTNELGKEFIYYYDTELKEWLMGAEIVIPESKSMNSAQLYGSALTYARRYTTLMALQLACDDDKDVENLNADGTKKGDAKKDSKATEKQIELIAKGCTESQIANIKNHFKITELSDLTVKEASEILSKMEKK